MKFKPHVYLSIYRIAFGVELYRGYNVNSLNLSIGIFHFGVSVFW